MPPGTTLTIPASGSVPAVPAYAVLPPGATRGIVVIHEIFGRAPEIDRVADKFAERGYAAVAPAIFEAMGMFPCMRHTMAALKTGSGPGVDVANAVRDWLSGTTGIAAPSIGIIGFCFGGGFALAAGRGWGAISTNYGDVPVAEVLRQLPPVIGCFGGRDKVFGKNAAVLEARAREVDANVEVHTFPEVGHSFLTDGDRPFVSALTRPLLHVEWNPSVAGAAWEKIFAFFDRELGDAAAPGATT